MEINGELVEREYRCTKYMYLYKIQLVLVHGRARHLSINEDNFVHVHVSKPSTEHIPVTHLVNAIL